MHFQFIQLGKESDHSIAVAAFIVSLISLFSTLYWNRRSEKRAYIDEFWFRTVLAPLCVTPILDFRNLCSNEITNLFANAVDAAAITDFLSVFAKEKEKVTDSVWMSQLVFSTYYEFCCGKLDGLEDDLAKSLGGSIVRGPAPTESFLRNLVSSEILEILREAARLHSKTMKVEKSARKK